MISYALFSLWPGGRSWFTFLLYLFQTSDAVLINIQTESLACLLPPCCNYLSSRPSIIFTVTSHLHTSFSVVTVLTEEHLLFLQHFHVCYKQQRTLFTERVKRLLSNLFQSESTTFLLGSKALARCHSLIFLFSFFPLSWWPLEVISRVTNIFKHPAKSCFPSVAWPRLWPLCCLLWRPQMFWSWFLNLFF